MKSSITESLFFWAALLAALACLSLAFGAVNISLSSQKGLAILLHLRIPRLCGAGLAGAGLALSGYLIQTVLDNPLASPSIVGIQSGAAFFTALAAALFPHVLSLPFSFLGALLSAFLVLFLAFHFKASRLTLVLSGLAISQIFSAGTDLLLTVFPDSLSSYASLKIGSLDGVTLKGMAAPACLIFVLVVLAFSFSGQLDILRLGMKKAASLGLDPYKWMVGLLGIAAGLAGSVLGFSGMLGFAGLIAPHLVRRLVHGSTKKELMACLLCGACLMVACDTLARVLARPYELPVSILLSLLGGPWFLYLLFCERRKRS